MVNATIMDIVQHFVVGKRRPMLKFHESIILLKLTRQIEIVKPGRCPMVTNVH